MSQAHSSPARKSIVPDVPVLLVDNNTLLAKKLAGRIAGSGIFSLSGIATTLDQGLQSLFTQKPRIVVLELVLPDGSGVDLIKACAQADWPVDAIVCSTLGIKSHIAEAVQAGAKGYLLKGSSFPTIEESIKAVLAGGYPISPAVAAFLIDAFKKSDKGPADQPQPTLTKREAEILALVSQGKKRQQIGTLLGISAGTVGNHITNIYRKLDVTTNVEAIRLAARMGMI